jgi:hypothetical protein
MDLSVIKKMIYFFNLRTSLIVSAKEDEPSQCRSLVLSNQQFVPVTRSLIREVRFYAMQNNND